MSKLQPPTSLNDTHEQIMNAAWARFVQYGFVKTTMAEIAQDCGMSAANLYRFFKSKQDIGAALASRCMAEKELRLQAVVDQPGISSAERLHVFALTVFDCMYTQCMGTPRINELIESVCMERSEIVTQHIQTMRALIAKILIKGKRDQEFAVKNVAATAAAIQAALIIFTIPHAVHLHTRKEFEVLARDVVGLIVQGIAKR